MTKSKVIIGLNAKCLDDETDQNGFARFRFDVVKDCQFGALKRLKLTYQASILRGNDLVLLNVYEDHNGQEYIL